MRVVAGTARGRRLTAPPGQSIRPTSDRVREAIFDMLQSLGGVEGAAVADLFAGTGALGVEALSRGAAAVTFVDDDRTAIDTIKANLAATRVEGGAVVRADAVRWAASAPPLDLAFADPPYAFDAWGELLAALPAELAVLESNRELELGEAWTILRLKRYGGTVVTVAERLGGAS